MKNKKPLPIRDLGGRFTINNPDDETPITQMFPLNSKFLIVLSEKCTYRMQMADQVDPDRKNPKLPPVIQQKLFDYGTKSELLCRTLLQAKVMFRKEFQSADVSKALQISFDAVGYLVSMDEIAKEFTAIEQAAIDKAQKLVKRDASLTLPTVGNVREKCKSFFQKADHFAISLMEIVRLFYPEMIGKNWADFKEFIESKYGPDDNFNKLLGLASPYLSLIRNARDCFEHKNLTGAVVSDFELQVDGNISLPCIEIDFRKTSLKRCTVSSFMSSAIKEMETCFELIVVHLCSKSVKPFAGFSMVVGLLPEAAQRAWYVRFAYGAYDQHGTFNPCG